MLLVLESFPPTPVFKAASREPSCGCPGSFPLSQPHQCQSQAFSLPSISLPAPPAPSTCCLLSLGVAQSAYSQTPPAALTREESLLLLDTPREATPFTRLLPTCFRPKTPDSCV